MPAQIEEEGSIAIPARLLTEFVGSLPNDKINLDLQGPSNQLQVTRVKQDTGRVVQDAHIAGQDAEDFPPIPTVGEAEPIMVESDALRRALGRVVFAAATDETRPVLTGVLTEFEGDRLTLAAAGACSPPDGVPTTLPDDLRGAAACDRLWGGLSCRRLALLYDLEIAFQPRPARHSQQHGGRGGGAFHLERRRLVDHGQRLAIAG